MSGAPPNVSADPEPRPVLGNAGNKARIAASSRKPSLKKLSSKAEKTGAAGGGVGEMRINNPPEPSPSWTPRLPNAPSALLMRQETFLRSNLSLNASCSSDCSVESFRSRASTGRIRGRPNLGGRRKQGFVRSDKTATRIENTRPDHVPASSPEVLEGKRRCPWVTPNTEPCYATFHDEEWGVPVHDDMKLFELLVLSGALAELTWPVILSKRHLFREAFMDFDPDAVSKLNEKKIAAPGSIASSLLSEPKLRSVIENARQILKIIEEFGSFDRYCWNFVNHKPIISQFRYPRQVPVKTPKSEFISKDLVRRGFRFVGPTVIYSFMQVCGMTNDHLVSCYRFQECTSLLQPVPHDGSCSKEARERVNYVEENTSPTTTNINTVTEDENVKVDIVLPIEINDLNIS